MAADDYSMISKHGKTAAATAVSPNSIKKPKERVPAKPDMPEVNCFLMCQLCSGYLIDATAIVECQHTFCKSCILKYLDTNSYCPICDVQLNKAKPHLSLRSDVIIQRLVYKLVPGLLVSEIRRRRDFSIKNGMDSVEAAELASNSIAEEIEAATDLSTVLSLDDVVSLSVEYFRSGEEKAPTDSGKVVNTNGKPSQSSSSTSSSSATTQSSQNQHQTQQQNQQQPKSNVKSNTVNSSSSSGGSNTSSTANSNTSAADCDSNSNSSEQANDRRYLQCPAAVSVGLLKKFIRMKYGLSDDYRVDLLYNGDRDSILENDLTLLDVAFIFKWNKDEPMKFHYRIFEKPKTLTVFSGMKRPAPSVMDEPPDDDMSGSHSRSSMFSSSSSAPSSKLPRLADNTNNGGNQGSVSKDNNSGKSTTASTTSAASVTNQDDGESNVTGSSTTKSSSKPIVKVEKVEVEEEDEDDEDEEEDYELVERKEHMKGIKSSRKNSIKESLKRSVASSNLRISSRSTHSTDTKGSKVEVSERESRNENSLNTSSKSKIIEVVKKPGRGRPPKTVSSLKLRVSSLDHSAAEHQTQSTGSLKLSISKSGVTPVISSNSSSSSASSTGEKKEPLKLSLGSVLANKAGKSPERKHHKHKHHHHHHKLRHRDKQSKGVTSIATVASVQQNSQKPLKISFTLSPPSGSQGNQGNQSQHVMIKECSSAVSTSGIEMKDQQKGKPLTGNQNFNNSARTSASAHGHLNNISKSISVSVNTNSANTSGNNNSSKGNQYGNKVLSPAELIPKNTGIEIQPTTMPISSSHGQISQQHQQSGNTVGSGGGSSSAPSHNVSSGGSSHKHSHPLLPDSVHVPKSVTLIPVNPPNQMNMPTSSMGKGSMGTSQEKGASGSQSNQNRINAHTHTFTHPITNKSLHQITVTEVPPPQKNNGNLGGSSGSNMNNSSCVSLNNTPHSSISGTTSNPIEKVIANAANNKPQFNGPGSMEITKIYCGAPGLKENPAKKLKDRKGLDISITGTGINVSVNKSSTKLEETLRQKVNIAIGGGSGSISVTPAPQNNSGNNAMNKAKSAAATAASLLSGKMPPGITIGPATVPTSSSGNNASSNINNMASANAGNNIMKGLGFTLPPHLTAHPHNPNNTLSKSLSSNQGKSDNKIGTTTLNTQNSRLLGKDSISIIGKGNVVQSLAGGQQQLQQPPPPVEITISAASSGSGNKSQTSITNKGISITSNNPKSKMNNDPLASILDITQGLRKSPTTAINNANAKDFKGMVNSLQQQQNSSSIPSANSHQQQQQISVPSLPLNKNIAGNKRAYEMSGSVQQNTSNNSKKPVKESPEAKRGRSASTSSDSSTSSGKKTGEGEIPLDLSGRSTRTTPPLNIPQFHSSREPSKSPTAQDKRAPSKSPDVVKPGIVITPPSSASNQTVTAAPVTSSLSLPNNFLSPKINHNQKSGAESLNKGQSIKSISVSKLSPNQSSKIGSIVDSLAQKQAQAQQQQQQQQQNSLKNSQNQSQQQHQQNVMKNIQNQPQQQQNAMKNIQNPPQQQQQQNVMKNAQNPTQQQQNVKNSQNTVQQNMNIKNSQIQQQQQNFNAKIPQNHHSHHLKSPSSTQSSNLNKSPNNSINHAHSSNNASSGVNVPNQKPSPGTNSKATSGLTSPISATPVMPMTSSSPPGGADHMRNLWSLNDAAARQGKMNELLAAAAAGLFSPPGHPHHMTNATAAHQLAAAAAVAGSSSSGGAASVFNPHNMFAQFGHQLAALGGNKISPGMFDPNFMAALNAHQQAAAAAAGMRMHHPFVGSMSPPLTLPNTYFPPHGSPSAGPQQPSPLPSNASAHQAPAAPQSGVKISNIPSQKPGNSGASNTSTGKSNSNPFAPLFSHSVPVSSAKSPTNICLTPGSSKSSQSAGAPNPVLPFTSTTSSSSSSATHDQKHSHSLSSVKSHHHHHHHHHQDKTSTLPSSGGCSISSTQSKSTKINGTMSTAMPVFPPGIHNPLLPSRSSSSNNSSQSANSALNKSFTSPMLQTNNMVKNPMKGGIPNSMKISNFLPSKPKDSNADANAEATITSGSNFGMPALQAKPNFSLSPTRAPSSESHMNTSSLIPSVNNAKSPSLGPLSPVKPLSSPGATNKPSSLTCASLLLPDYSKPPHLLHHHSQHPLNSLSPTKGDLGLSLSRSNRTPSSDTILLSPTKTSPGASPSSAFIKAGSNNKDGFRSDAQSQGKNVSQGKDDMVNSKKEIGNIPMGPQQTAVVGGGLSLPRNFPISSTHNTQSLSLVNRPIPTIPAFFNRSSSNSGGVMPSANPIVNHHHQLHHKGSSPPGKAPKSPVKPHLPSPVFPFPGVSVPVQVKLQDDEVPTSSAAKQVSLKTEVNKLLAAKEEKIEEQRRRSTEQNLDLKRASSPEKSLVTFSPESRKMKCEENPSEIRPTKVQKVDTLEATCSSVKNVKENSPVSESRESNDDGKVSKGTEKKNESESTQREFKAGEGEQESKKGDGADPSKEFSVSDPTTVPALTTQSLCKTEAKAPSPIKSTAEVFSPENVPNAVEQQPPPQSSPPPLKPAQASTVHAVENDKSLEEKQTEGKSVEAEEENIDISIIPEKTSETQIVLDMDIPKSDEALAQVNRQESNNLDEIPDERKTGQVGIDECDENTNIDVEMEDEPRSHELGQSEQQPLMEMDTDVGKTDGDDNDNQMEIDVEGNDEKMEESDIGEKQFPGENDNLMVEERVTLTREDEDVDVDVGIDEPMEVNTECIMKSIDENIIESEETLPVADVGIISKTQEETALLSTQIELEEHNDHQNDNVSSENELIESQPESITACVSENTELNENVEDKEEKFLKDSIEISEDVIKGQKLEETSEEIQAELESSEKMMENEEKFQEPLFFAENEASNLSQDDSECGELVIDLGPGEELENDEQKYQEMDDNNAEEATQEESQDSSKQVSQWMEGSSKPCELEQAEKNDEALAQQELSSLVSDQFSTSSINMESSETVPEVHAEQPSEAEVDGDDDESNNKRMNEEISSTSSIVSPDNGEGSLNQNSISNQISINSESNEVNRVIKSENESCERECLEEKPAATPEVDDLQQEEQSACEELPEQEEKNEMVEHHSEENEGQVNTNDTPEEAGISQLDQELSTSEDKSFSFPASESEKDNEISEENEAVLEIHAVIENEEEQVAQEQESLDIVLTSAAASPLETNETLVETGATCEEMLTATTPVQIPQKSNNVEESAHISATDECPMEIEEAFENETNDDEMTDPVIESMGQEQTLQEKCENFPVSEIISPENDDESTQMELDSGLPTSDSSQSLPSSSITQDEERKTPTLIEGKNEDSQTIDNDGTSEVNNENVDVAVISATITTASASAVAASADINSADSSVSSTVTPTTASSSSLAIKLDIAANDDDLGCNTSAESLLPAGNGSLSSSSKAPSQDSPSSSSSSSSSITASSSSHVNNTAGLKSLETFGKVAAGFLASATSTINNNNNNTSLAPTSCDAISIATTNANA